MNNMGKKELQGLDQDPKAIIHLKTLRTILKKVSN